MDGGKELRTSTAATFLFQTIMTGGQAIYLDEP
jgi:hypothetical protein